MGKLRVVAVPAAFALVLMGTAGAPGTRVSGSSVRQLNPSPGPTPVHAPAENQEAVLLPHVTRPPGDFNGDGFTDLAVGAPFEDVVGTEDAGAVNVVYGSATGLVSAGNQYWHQDIGGIGDNVERSDQFGFAATTGDFNGDEFDDLAVGVPLEDAPEDSGAVNVIYGSAAGLTSAGSQVWTQDSAGIGDHREPGDQFGRALVAGDFNHDNAADLAIGVPFERVSSRGHAGAVNVIYGSPQGLTASGNQFWSQASSGIAGSPGTGDTFGASLALGDFDGDTFADLAVGVAREDKPLDSGAVNVIYGSAAGLVAAGNQLWSQNSAGVGGTAEWNDLFGFALAAGDFDDDSFADLVVGVPFEDLGSRANAGAVNVLYGTANGLAAGRNRLWTQDSSGIVNAAEARDQFGFAAAVDDFNRDGFTDLAIGVPGEDPPGNAGGVAVMLGGAAGLSAAGDQFWTQEALGGSPNEVWDTFGFSLMAGRFGGDSAGDLAIGVPSEDVLTTTDAGAINIAYGSAQGLGPEGSQYWTQDDLAGPAERGDRFSYGLGGNSPA